MYRCAFQFCLTTSGFWVYSTGYLLVFGCMHVCNVYKWVVLGNVEDYTHYLHQLACVSSFCWDVLLLVSLPRRA